MTSQIINIAIVLMAIYIALAVVCSWLQEQVAAVLKLRATTLAKGIAELVSRDAGVVDGLSSHPLLNAASSEAGTQFPSYVDARNFTLAYWQTIATIVDAAQGTSLGRAVGDPKVAFAGLLSGVNGWTPSTDSAQRLKRSTVALLMAAEGDYDKLLIATDTWFNAQMDRVSGWYKRNAQYILVVIAFVLAFGSRIDTIDVGGQLFTAPAIAQATGQAISDAVNQNKSDTRSGTAAVTKAIADAQGLQNLRLSHWLGAPGHHSYASEFFGLLITAIAVSLGAPFWFDLLKGVVNVRMAGAKPIGTPPLTTPAPS
ncbi:MAG: hypothetical protein IAI49_02320 [Candidatus Eremiobacteraeota bacterium]|nr:hypothetical protein [Candidatus Eremiobacteraeota bacterium]